MLIPWRVSFGNSDMAMENTHRVGSGEKQLRFPGQSRLDLSPPRIPVTFPRKTYIFRLVLNPGFTKTSFKPRFHPRTWGGSRSKKSQRFSRLQDQVSQESTLEVEAS